MDITTNPVTQPQSPGAPPVSKEVKAEESFFPSGAIVFFLLLVALCLIIWFGIYFLMIERI